jgi:hypothetical protein
MDEAVAALMKDYPLPSSKEKFPTFDKLFERCFLAVKAETGYAAVNPVVNSSDFQLKHKINCGQASGAKQRNKKCRWHVLAKRRSIFDPWYLHKPPQTLEHTNHPPKRPTIRKRKTLVKKHRDFWRRRMYTFLPLSWNHK